MKQSRRKESDLPQLPCEEPFSFEAPESTVLPVPPSEKQPDSPPPGTSATLSSDAVTSLLQLYLSRKCEQPRIPTPDAPPPCDPLAEVARLGLLGPEWDLQPLFLMETLTAIDWPRLADWMRRLDPLFIALERLAYITPGSAPAPHMPYRAFERRIVLSILLAGFLPGLIDTGLPSAQTPAKGLCRTWRALCTVWRGASHPSHQKAGVEMLADTLAALVLSGLRRRRLNRKCPALSTVITALASYLSQCQAFQAAPFSGAERYEVIGAIIQAVTVPSCPACGRTHHFPDWRWVKGRDKYKGPWEQRHLWELRKGHPHR
jgi:hypothetical protein